MSVFLKGFEQYLALYYIMFIKWKGADLGFFLVSGLAPDVLIFHLTSAFLLCPELWSVLENTKQWEGGPLPRRHLPVSWVTEPRGMKPTVKLLESRADVVGCSHLSRQACSPMGGSHPSPYSHPSLQTGQFSKESTVGARDPLGLCDETVLLCSLALAPWTSLSCACTQEHTLEGGSAPAAMRSWCPDPQGHSEEPPTLCERFLGSRRHFLPPEKPAGLVLVRLQTWASPILSGIRAGSGCTSENWKWELWWQPRQEGQWH